MKAVLCAILLACVFQVQAREYTQQEREGLMQAICKALLQQDPNDKQAKEHCRKYDKTTLRKTNA